MICPPALVRSWFSSLGILETFPGSCCSHWCFPLAFPLKGFLHTFMRLLWPLQGWSLSRITRGAGMGILTLLAVNCLFSRRNLCLAWRCFPFSLMILALTLRDWPRLWSPNCTKSDIEMAMRQAPRAPSARSSGFWGAAPPRAGSRPFARAISQRLSPLI
jgi:hypothetical protein